MPVGRERGCGRYEKEPHSSPKRRSCTHRGLKWRKSADRSQGCVGEGQRTTARPRYSSTISPLLLILPPVRALEIGIVLFAVAFIGSSAAAGQTPTLQAGKLTSPLTIDGRLDEL